MKQEYLGDGAYITIDRDYHGQFILTANHHDPDSTMTTDVIHLGHCELVNLIMIARAEGYIFGNDTEEKES